MEILIGAHRTALNAGLKYAYTGNMHHKAGNKYTVFHASVQ